MRGIVTVAAMHTLYMIDCTYIGGFASIFSVMALDMVVYAFLGWRSTEPGHIYVLTGGQGVAPWDEYSIGHGIRQLVMNDYNRLYSTLQLCSM